MMERLAVWRDPVARPGPENMAVDEWLLEHAREPTLRVYEWKGDWISVGYFNPMEAAQRWAGPDVEVVRRATGGGMVDHRSDSTYTLVVPRGIGLANQKSVESYRVIHHALAESMQELGVDAELIAEDARSTSLACFEKPVAWDIVDRNGRKLAGAGQRRTRAGLLHQGSVALPDPPPRLFEAFAARLASCVETVDCEPSQDDLVAAREKFASERWATRR